MNWMDLTANGCRAFSCLPPFRIDEDPWVSEHTLGEEILFVRRIAVGSKLVRLEVGRAVGVVVAARANVHRVSPSIIPQLEHDVSALGALHHKPVTGAL